MRLLNDLEAIQSENPANQLQVRMSKHHMVTLEILVHRDLGSRSDHVIEKERSDEQADDQGSEYAPQPRTETGAFDKHSLTKKGKEQALSGIPENPDVVRVLTAANHLGA